MESLEKPGMILTPLKTKLSIATALLLGYELAAIFGNHGHQEAMEPHQPHAEETSPSGNVPVFASKTVTGSTVSSTYGIFDTLSPIRDSIRAHLTKVRAN